MKRYVSPAIQLLTPDTVDILTGSTGLLNDHYTDEPTYWNFDNAGNLYRLLQLLEGVSKSVTPRGDSCPAIVTPKELFRLAGADRSPLISRLRDSFPPRGSLW